MKVIVAIKQVPARDSSIRIAAGARWIATSDLSFEINEPDAYALETALKLKDKHGGEVVVVCAARSGAMPTIREALAKGADRATLVTCERIETLDTLAVARLLGLAIGDEKPDVILTGLQSDDLGLGQMGVVLSEILGVCTRPSSWISKCTPGAFA
ncbi:MAG TPA: hypothetical protein VML19_14230 [Verrucomicrobiae bacterium]|nr:hypothetical protein [Verrucomicrobiae bacterium]